MKFGKLLLFLALTISSSLASDKWMSFSSSNNSNNLKMYKPKSSIGSVESIKTKANTLPRIDNLELENKINKNVIPKISKNHKIRVEYFANSKIIKKKSSYLGKVKDGASIEYYSNGAVMLKAHYSNGKKHGVETIYDDSGKVYRKYFYINGKKQKDK